MAGAFTRHASRLNSPLIGYTIDKKEQAVVFSQIEGAEMKDRDKTKESII